jgi:hypothetical protein
MVSTRTLEFYTVVFAAGLAISVTIALICAIVVRIEYPETPVCTVVTVIEQTGELLANAKLVAHVFFAVALTTAVGLLRLVMYAYQMGVLTEARAGFRLITIALSFGSLLYLLGLHLRDLSGMRTDDIERCAREYRVVPGEKLSVTASAVILAAAVSVVSAGVIRYWMAHNSTWARRKTRQIVLSPALYGL